MYCNLLLKKINKLQKKKKKKKKNRHSRSRSKYPLKIDSIKSQRFKTTTHFKKDKSPTFLCDSIVN